MKKIIIFILFISSISIKAQNIQILGGIGSDKTFTNFITTEIFRPLEYGKFYYFTDFKINQNGYFDSYSEISKYWNLTKTGFSITGQINLGMYIDTITMKGFQINPVYLVGFSKEGSVGKWILSLDVLYRSDQGLNDQGAQLTGCFLRDTEHFQISGYCDLWQTTNSAAYTKNKNNSVIIIFEPQAWWKFSKRIYLGIEGRVSNFDNEDLGLGNYSSYCMIGFKWNLEN